MAEIELSVFDCGLKEYIPDDEILVIEVVAFVDNRNGADATVDWQFRIEDARIWLIRLYSFISD